MMVMEDAALLGARAADKMFMFDFSYDGYF